MTKKDGGKVHSPTFGKIIVALLHDLTITEGAKILYAHMHWRYGENHDNHEGQKSMAKYLGVSEKTIRNRIDELEANDWVVTIYQERDDKKKQWQRCYYHVFEIQEECRTFRAKYKAKDNEEIKAKPEGRQRKPRTGAGNPEPKLPGRQNSGSNGAVGTQVPTDSGTQVPTGRQNSGSEDLDSSIYLDSSIQTQKDPTPKGVDNPKHSKAELDAMYDAVAEAWGTKASGFIVSIRGMLMGTAKRGAWKECNFDPPATTQEVRAFKQWWSGAKLNMPEKPEVIQKEFYKFRQYQQRLQREREATLERMADDFDLPPDTLSANPYIDAELKKLALKLSGKSA